MSSELGIDGLVFTRYEEAKEAHGSKKFHKFFLVDSANNRHLAATGEDTGDAHYNYSSSKPFNKFGAISCHNRQKVLQWLESIIVETGGTEGAVVEATDEEAHEKVIFVEHRNERTQTEDGRRVNKWFLVDQHGKAHLAVVGVERETKDGHYSYHAEEPFATLVPLVSSNQAGVFKWLERMLTHRHADAHGVQGDALIVTPAALATAAAASAATGGALAIAAGRGKMTPRARASGGKGGQRPGGGAGPPPSPGSGAAAPAAAVPAAPGALTPVASPRPAATGGLPGPVLVPGHAAPGVPTAAAAAAAAAAPPDAAAAAASAPPAAPDGGGGAAGAPLAAGGDAGRPKPLVIDLALLQRLKGGGTAPAAAAAPAAPAAAALSAARSKQKGATNQKNKPVGIVEQMQQKRLKKLQDDARTEEAQLQANHLAALRRAAAAEAAGDTAARRLTLEWMCAPPTDEEAQNIGHWINTLRELEEDRIPDAKAAAGGGGAAAYRNAANQAHGVRVALECLKELRDVFMPLALMVQSQVVSTVRAYTSHPHPAVSAAARQLLDHWRQLLSGHLGVLTNPAYVADPAAELEEDIRAGRVPLPTLPLHRQAALAAAAAAQAALASKGGAGAGGGAAAAGFLTPAPPAKAAAGGAGPASAPAGGWQQQQGGEALRLQQSDQLLVDLGPQLDGAAAALGATPMQVDGAAM